MSRRGWSTRSCTTTSPRSRVAGRWVTRCFFQGGVALNRAVGHAFAQCLDKPVVIPPHPELLGAIGVALLATERSRDAVAEVRDLASLANPAMRRIGQFTCQACGNHCTIDRFEVARRRFPFGGRCSLYENVRKAKDGRTKEVVDLVAERNELIFAAATPSLTSWKACPRKSFSGRCPASHRHSPGTHRAFALPALRHVLPATGHGRRPVRYRSGRLVEGQFRLLFPCPDCPRCRVGPGQARRRHGVSSSRQQDAESRRPSGFVSVPRHPGQSLFHFQGVSRRHVSLAAVELLPEVTRPATNWWIWPAASWGSPGHGRRGLPRSGPRAVGDGTVDAQLGRQALDDALADGKPTVILVGRSYNAFPAEASQSVAKKLSSMGVRVIPGDCLPQQTAGPTSWHYPNIIMNAVELVKRHRNLFLLYVSNFSCTIDAFTHSMLSVGTGCQALSDARN